MARSKPAQRDFGGTATKFLMLTATAGLAVARPCSGDTRGHPGNLVSPGRTAQGQHMALGLQANTCVPRARQDTNCPINTDSTATGCQLQRAARRFLNVSEAASHSDGT